MKKQTKIALVLGAVAIGGFLLWNSRKPKKNLSGLKMNADGDCGCNKKANAGGIAGQVQLPDFGKPVKLK